MRLTFFLLLSVVFHTVLICSLPAMSASPTISLKKPIWVELMEVEESPPPDTVVESSTSKPQKISVEAIKSKPQRTVSPKSVEKPLPRLESDGNPPPEVKKPAPKTKNLAALYPSDENNLSFGLKGDRELLPDELEYEKYLMEIKRRVLEIKRKVERNWKVELDSETREGTTIILALVRGDGSLWSIDILKPSGAILHDYEALEAVKKAFPLRPPPKSLLNEKGKLPIRFSVHYLMNAPS